MYWSIRCMKTLAGPEGGNCLFLILQPQKGDTVVVHQIGTERTTMTTI